MPDAKWYASWVRMIPAETAPEKTRNLEAADLIESLAAELEQVKQERDGLSIMLGQAQSMLETRTRERDAAVEDILKECHKCKHFKVMSNGCTPDYDCDYSDVCEDGNHWQWRGVRKD